jgi:hypothetical protein
VGQEKVDDGVAVVRLTPLAGLGGDVERWRLLLLLLLLLLLRLLLLLLRLLLLNRLQGTSSRCNANANANAERNMQTVLQSCCASRLARHAPSARLARSIATLAHVT